MYHSLVKERPSSKECPPPNFGPIFCIGSKFTQMSTHPGVTFVWLMVCTHGVLEAQPQVPCISEVRNFGLYACYKVALRRHK